MRLATETRGTGADLVLLHGWGMHSGVWGEFADRLAGNYRVTGIDLPGHGLSEWVPQANGLDAWAAACLEMAPERAVWVGWSLGGLLALRAASFAPERVCAMVMLAGTPRFVRKDDWPNAVPLGTLGQFDVALREDYHRTLERFLALQVRGSNDARATLRRLRGVMRGRGEPHPLGLEVGLQILRNSDLRALVLGLSQPSLWLFGERDTLVPVGAADAILALSGQVEVQAIGGAGHAPFLSHREECLTHVQKFLSRVQP